MRKLKRLISLATSLALMAALFLPVSANTAGESSFTDVKDGPTAVNADILRLMGVVSGVGSNQFNPDGVLTRGQFCAMVVSFMQKGDQVALHSTRTIFTDVPGSHWARGYVNLASSLTVKDGERELPLVSGVGDGRFQPDEKITQAQAATILIRMLGYTSAQAGAVWPQSYMDLAGSIGLRSGLPQDYNAPLTRAHAAQMFVNALSCKMQEGKEYYTSLGEEKKDVVLLAVNVSTDTGDAMGAVRTSQGTFLPKAEGAAPTALQGRRGSLILNENQEIVTFVPDDTQALTITLSGDAQPGYLKAGGKQYNVASDTMVYTADQAEGKSYLDSYSSLYSGTQVTLFIQRGKVVSIYANSATTSAEADAVVVMGDATVATFHQLTGGATGFKVVKNRQEVKLSDIKPYDVVTYDKLSNTLTVSDLRISCVYQNAQPTVASPKTITVLGNEFQVLESAWNMTKDFNLGQNVILLLTADGKVAGMAAPSTKIRSTAVAMVEGGSAKVFLPNGGTLDLKGTLADAEKLEGQLVVVSGKKSNFTGTKISDSSVPGDFNVDRMTLGEYTVVSGVRIFEKVGANALAPIDLGSLTMGKIPEDKISGCHINSSGMVEFIVLDNVTGNAYEYGMMVGTQVDGGVDESGNAITKTNWRLVRGVSEDLEFSPTAGYVGKTGDIVGVAVYKSSEGKDMIRTVLRLDEVSHVSGKAFFESQGALYVSVNGRNYRVADDAECYGGMGGNRSDPNSWFTQAELKDRVNAMKAYSNDLKLYIDPVGQQVRVITAG